jgi:hypothetical protein
MPTTRDNLQALIDCLHKHGPMDTAAILGCEDDDLAQATVIGRLMGLAEALLAELELEDIGA